MSTAPDLWQKIKENELKRLRQALDDAAKEVVNQKFTGRALRGEALGEVADFNSLARKVSGVLMFLAERAARHVPSPANQLRWGSEWEVYLSGLRYFLGRIEGSYLTRAVAPAFKAEAISERVTSLSQAAIRLMPSFYGIARHMQEYVSNRERGMDVWESYSSEEPDERLISAYASWKTWESAEKHEAFFNSLKSGIESGIEIYIEGPLQLYLIITRDYFSIVWRLFAAEKLSEFPEARELQSAQALNDFVSNIVQDSELRPIATSLIKQAAKNYLEDLFSQEKETRRFVEPESRLRFISDFESGRLIRKT